MKSLLFSLSFLLLGMVASAQNCGLVTSFTANIVNNNNGTHTYTFDITMSATSGGVKSLILTIRCPNNVFVLNQCEATLQNASRTVTYGPFITTSCTGGIELLWTGKTNAVCGGSTCSAQQSIPLPVELAAFRASKQETAAVLDWATASELNNEKFVVERSNDGLAFQPIGEVAGNGTTFEAKNYRFSDENPATGTNYYRLKQMDFDGKTEYSKVATIEFVSEDEVLIFPTIVGETLHITVPKKNAFEETMLTVYNLQGALVFSQAQSGSLGYEVSMPDLPAGQYLAHVTCGSLSKRTLIFKH